MSKNFLIKLKSVYNLYIKKKLSLSKIVNVAVCNWKYYRRDLLSGASPIIIFFETSNRCNLYCVACRKSQTEIFDQNPNGSGDFIPTGNMPLPLFKRTLDDVKKHLLMAVLYVNGEPLLRRDIGDFVRYATECNVATMISTNGMLLDEKKSETILTAGVDIIKIAVSGYTQDVYGVNHRGGDIEVIKKNLENLMRLHKERSFKTVVFLDYILFEHNRNESAMWRKHCANLGITFNIRMGISQDQKGVIEVDGGLAPSPKLCDWLWKIMTVNWDGTVFPCCEYATWKDARGISRLSESEGNLRAIWNGKKYQTFRNVHITKGRSAIPRCIDCHYNGIGIQG